MLAVSLKSPAQVERIHGSCRMVGEVLAAIGEAIRPGATTGELNELAEKMVSDWKVKAAFKGLYGFPESVCISVNEEVVHGIPSFERVLAEGDIVSCDFGIKAEGFYGDAARTWPVGAVGDGTRRLLDVTWEALDLAIDQCRNGRRVGDIGHAIQSHCEEHGFGVVRDFVGHGLGRKLHEDPQVPNYGKAGRGKRLRPGMVLALEPMVCEGTWEVETLGDGWTVVTKDRGLSAHFEDTVVITDNGAVNLTRLA